MKRYCLTLDLKNDPALIDEYENWHKPENSWPEITDSIKSAGIVHMHIYRVANRLFMIMEVDDSFSFLRKEEMDKQNDKVQEWEQLMWKYQQPLPFAKEGQKWLLMDTIFEL